MVFALETPSESQMRTLFSVVKQLDSSLNGFIDAFATKFGQVAVGEARNLDDQATAIDLLIYKVESDVSLLEALASAFRREVLKKIGDSNK